jgi:putative flippase GtrA
MVVSKRHRWGSGDEPVHVDCGLHAPAGSGSYCVRVPYVKSFRDRLRQSWRIVVKELSAFGVVGAACFAIDLALFQAFYAHVGLGAVTSKLLSTVVSMTAAYFAHRYWSFAHRGRTGLRREYALFFLVNGLTLLLSLAIVAVVRYPLGQDSALALQIANVVSTAIGTLIRFVCYRTWIFVSANAPVAIAHAEKRERREADRTAA